jgi:hypothetical protein
MDQGSLVNEQIEAGAKVAAEFDKYAPLAAAFWAKDIEYKDWYLYLASEQINSTNFDLAYGEVVRIFGDKKRPGMDIFQIKVAGLDNPLVKGVCDLQRAYPNVAGSHLWTRRLGEVMVEDAYIYPLPVSVAG